MGDCWESNDGKPAGGYRERIDALNRDLDKYIDFLERKYKVRIPKNLRQRFGVSETITLEVFDRHTGKLKEKRVIKDGKEVEKWSLQVKEWQM